MKYLFGCFCACMLLLSCTGFKSTTDGHVTRKTDNDSVVINTTIQTDGKGEKTGN